MKKLGWKKQSQSGSGNTVLLRWGKNTLECGKGRISTVPKRSKIE